MKVTFRYRIFDRFGDCLKTGKVKSSEVKSESQAKNSFEARCKKEIPRFYSVEFWEISNDTKAVNSSEEGERLFNSIFGSFKHKK